MYKLKHNYKIATCVVNIYHKNNKSKEYIYIFFKGTYRGLLFCSGL